MPTPAALRGLAAFTDVDARDVTVRHLDGTSVNVGNTAVQNLTGSGTLKWTGTSPFNMSGSMQSGYISIAAGVLSGSATFGAKFVSTADIKVLLTPSGSAADNANKWWNTGSCAASINSGSFVAVYSGVPLAIVATYSYLALAI